MISSTFARLTLSLALSTSFTAPLAAQDTASDTVAAADPVAVGWNPADWDLEDSEFAPEAGWHFGKLDNGMRYIIRRNNRPEGTALVRMEIAAGSLDERDDERGFAHYLEHMAFNGSTNVPEGEMIKLLEREGLAFGADTNASTGFERTQYKLNLPKADPALLDTALMLMRETASELIIAPQAVERERGVILSERRVRNDYNLQNTVDRLEFAYPEARISQRLPIGTIETLEAADAAGLRAFWQREYIPADTVLVVVGDFDPAVVEANIRHRFADWQAAESPQQPAAGPVDPAFGGQTDIYLDPALTESVTILRNDVFADRPDTVANSKQDLLYSIAANALARRLQRIQRSEDPPFRGVSISSGDFFNDARTTQISVSTEEGSWKRGLDVAIDEARRALQFGFNEAEIAEQIANMRTQYENAAANGATRSNGAFVEDAFAIARGDGVPASPDLALFFFNHTAPEITPEAVIENYRERMGGLENPLIRFTGKVAPQGGTEALRQAVEVAFSRVVMPPENSGSGEFAYQSFGPTGQIVSDMRTEKLDIRTLQFANGVRLNLKPTDLEDDRISIQVAIDGGQMLATQSNPLAVELDGLLPSGGLGKHSLDELQSILAGRSVSPSFGTGSETFVSTATTTPRDFELQMQLFAAFVTDPGYRPEGLGPWRKSLDDYFARLGKTPGSAFGEASRAILSDNDPRFTRQPIEAYRELDFEKLETIISERLGRGAIEIGIVGDFDEGEAIKNVAQTFGALPVRENDFRPYGGGQRIRDFTGYLGPHIITHGGEPDQAMIQLVWPTSDDEDTQRTSRFNLLERIVRLQLTAKLREELGQVYSPSVDSSQSGTYIGYGTFTVGASVDLSQIDAAKAAMLEVIENLRNTAPDADLIQRARQPVLEMFDNRLKSNAGWMSLVSRAQSEPEYIDIFTDAQQRYLGITGAELQALAIEYLDPAKAVEFRVVPEDKGRVEEK